MIDPTTDRLVFVRFKDRAIFELAVRNAAGAWNWYEAANCHRDQRTYLMLTEIGEPLSISVCCDDDEMAAFFWADPDLVPKAAIQVLPGGPCVRLPTLPAFLQEEQWRSWCESLVYAAEVIPCIFCQDLFPIAATVPEEDQRPCPHIAWCERCQMWSSPYYPGKEEEMEHCPHRSEDDLSLRVRMEPGEDSRMTKLDEELAALLTPLGVSVEQPTAHLPIHVEFLGERASYDLTAIGVKRVDETRVVSSVWHGSTRLLEADEAFDTIGGSVLEGVCFSPCTPQVERLLAKKRIPWCAYPEQCIVLAALPRREIVSLLLCLGHEYVLAARRRWYRQQRAAQVFSERLRQVLWQGEGTRLLCSFSDEWSCAWLDGLCNLLAEGLLEWVCASGQQLVESLAPHLMILAGEGKAVDHIVLQVGTWFLDGDGVRDSKRIKYPVRLA